MKKNKEELISQFNPSGIGIENGNFIGLPFDLETSDIVIYTVPWDVTVSYSDGTSRGPQNLLDASYQLDLYLEDHPDLWKKGIYLIPPSGELLLKNDELRKKSALYIQLLERGEILDEENIILEKINKACSQLHEQVQRETTDLLKKGKKVALLGGEHSVPLGFIKALAEIHGEFGILQFDAHCDLRKAYEGFTYSHASIFYNVLSEIPQVKQLTQIGIRDFCEEEYLFIQQDERISLFTDQAIRNSIFEGNHFKKISQSIIDTLPQKVYISFDIDGLSPDLCPNTGTPVPGGFSFNEIVFICQLLEKSGREIIGFDLSEVAGEGNWDGNVGARILYRLMSLL